MNRDDVCLLDLPNEILLLILKKLANVDVLHSLFGINNQRLDIIAQEEIFNNNLNFVSNSQSSDEISSVSDSILDRFCNDILPRIRMNVKSLILESGSIERILGAGSYPNLTELKLYNFNKAIVSLYFMDGSLVGHIFKRQITHLILISKENNTEITRKEYTRNVYAMILAFFENLKNLTIVLSSVNNYPSLSLYDLPPTTFSSLTLTKLCISVHGFNDVRALLDGRLKQLTIFIVQVESIGSQISTHDNGDDLINLKCFSLTCYNHLTGYNNQALSFLRRMTHLEELTIHLYICGGPTFISGTHLDNEILIYMPQLHTFTFYIDCQNAVGGNTDICVSTDDIKKTFTDIEHRQVDCMVDYYESMKIICRVFSLPFKFHRLERIGNNIPNIVFNSVTHLKLWDKNAFKHEFFVRLARAFPFVKNLSIWNIKPAYLEIPEFHLRDKDWCSLVEYPHLISLDIDSVHFSYAEHFLNETDTHLPRLTELKIGYEALKMVTKDFTNNKMRRNCAKVKQLIIDKQIVHPKNFYCYFSSLSS